MNEQKWHDLQNKVTAHIEGNPDSCSQLLQELFDEMKELRAENDRLRIALITARKQNGNYNHMSTKLKDALYE
ncbi:hypothetical protein [Paenibacillus sp.]|uniref:hypothetical protein n=1 Tax=Paenibacillus sp. TaxID=58172 RepID=UPI0034646204